jgi:hypothetical protein
MAMNPTTTATAVVKAFVLLHPGTCSGDAALKELILKATQWINNKKRFIKDTIPLAYTLLFLDGGKFKKEFDPEGEPGTVHFAIDNGMVRMKILRVLSDIEHHCFQIRRKGTAKAGEEVDQDSEMGPEWVWLQSEQVSLSHEVGDVSDAVCREVFALCIETQIKQHAVQYCLPNTIGTAVAWVFPYCFVVITHLLVTMQECARMLALVRRAILEDLDAATGATIPTANGWPAAVPASLRKALESTWDTMQTPPAKHKK